MHTILENVSLTTKGGEEVESAFMYRRRCQGGSNFLGFILAPREQRPRGLAASQKA